MKLVVGILAHVDAGKTTLSEAMLYISGAIRKLGRVDKGDAFLDTDAQERERGITIFSKQAVFTYRDLEICLLDTPGHVDFGTEMERTLQVLDYALLVINGADGVQAHTRTLLTLLERYRVPTFLFINKMDQPGTDKEVLLKALKEALPYGCVDFSVRDGAAFYEEIAMCSEAALELFLQSGRVEAAMIRELIRKRRLFPCFFGSALKVEGVEELLAGLVEYTDEPSYPQDFGGRIFKITRDEKGNRLTWLKVTGGCLKVRDLIEEEKISQIRIYSGEKYETAQEVSAGSICAVTGLAASYPGEGLGHEQGELPPMLEPVLTYRVILPSDTDAAAVLPKLRQLEEEDPQLHLLWEESLQEIQVRIMGEVQLEVLKELVKQRFGLEIAFGAGSVVYKESIKTPAIGVGHFEPLRHYAEVQLLLEPGEPGSGISLHTACSEDVLAKNWQRLILTHLEEKEHRGVLAGMVLTDVKITLLAGRAHPKHTEGGDFRQATYRAVRQGLMEAESVLLEPYYAFRLVVPEGLVGRAMTDIENRGGKVSLPEFEEGQAILNGRAPVSALREYQVELTAYSKGEGSLSCSLCGYFPCHNTEEVLAECFYDPEADLSNPTGSVFCAHGAGFVVPWYEVKNYAHLGIAKIGDDSVTGQKEEDLSGTGYSARYPMPREKETPVIGTEEIDRILKNAAGANKRDDTKPRKGIYRRDKAAPTLSQTRTYKPIRRQEEYLLVDGYNVIFAWEELREIAKVSIDGARGRLLDILCDYQAAKGMELIVVFDAYRVEGHATETLDYHNIHVVYTKEAETADRFIEKFAHENNNRYRITVATSDGLEQIIIRGQGCYLLSARELKDEVERTKTALREDYLSGRGEPGGKRYLLDDFDKSVLEGNTLPSVGQNEGSGGVQSEQDQEKTDQIPSEGR